MKKHWRRGLLLAVSVALLLIGTGVAFSMGPHVTIAPDAGYYGQRFEFTCTGFFPSETVRVDFSWPDGSYCCWQDHLTDINGEADCGGWTAAEGEPVGVYRVLFTGINSEASVEAFFEVLRVEFVPEPGTIALLGSGLVGLAGYATLRWRARE